MSPRAWLPSSTQLFATVAIATAITVFLSASTQPAAADTGSPARPILVVGQLRFCTPSLSWQQLTAEAQALQGGSSTNDHASHLISTTGTVRVGCSLDLPAAPQASTGGSWQPWPLQQGQEVQVSGLDALDCLVHAENADKGVAQAPYVFLLRPTGA